MKPLTVITSAGAIFASPTQIVPVMAESGEFEDRLVTERNALVGKVARFRGEHVKIGLDEIISTLQRLVPGYVNARHYCFERAPDGYETTKLRRDIITALHALDANLFEEEERESQALEDRIFRREGADFSQNTLTRLKNYVDERLRGEHIERDRETYAGWISGKTIHPEDLEGAVMVADALHNAELYRRAVEIRDDLQNNKAGNGYFLLTGIHRVVSRRLAAPKGEGAGIHRDRQERPQQGSRVFPQFPDWYGALVEELGPRIEEGIVDAVIHDIRVSEQQPSSGSVRDKASGPGLARGLMMFSDDGERDEVYSKIRVPKPERRQDSLMRRLEEMFDVYGMVLEDYVGCLLASLTLDKINSTGNNKARLERADVERADLGTLSMVELVYEGKTLLVPGFGRIHSLSPLFDYGFEKQLDLGVARINLLRLLAKNRSERRAYEREVQRHLPKESPLYETFMRVYNSSLLFQSLYSPAEFTMRITAYLRNREISQLRELEEIQFHERSARIDLLERSIEVAKQRVKAVLHHGYPNFQEGIEQLRQADREIPLELAIFRSFPYVSGLISPGGSKDAASSERGVLFTVLDAYRIEHGVFMGMLDGAILRAAKEYSDFMGERDTVTPGTDTATDEKVLLPAGGSPVPAPVVIKSRDNALQAGVGRMFDAYGRVVDMYVRRALTSLIVINPLAEYGVEDTDKSDFTFMLINSHGSSLVDRLEPLKPSVPEGAPFMCVDQVRHDDRSFIFPTLFNLRFLSPMYGYDTEKMLAAYYAWVGLLDNFSRDRGAMLEYLRDSKRALPQSSPLFPLLSEAYQSSPLLQSLYGQEQFIGSMTRVMRRADTITLESLARESPAERARHLQLIRQRTDVVADHVRAVFRYSGATYDREFFGAVADLKKADAELPPEIPLFRSFPHASGLLECEKAASSEGEVLFAVLGKHEIDMHSYFGLDKYAVLCAANAFGDWSGGERVAGLAELFKLHAPFFEPMAEARSQGADAMSQGAAARALNPLQRIGGFLGRYLPKVDLHIG